MHVQPTSEQQLAKLGVNVEHEVGEEELADDRGWDALHCLDDKFEACNLWKKCKSSSIAQHEHQCYVWVKDVHRVWVIVSRTDDKPGQACYLQEKFKVNELFLLPDVFWPQYHEIKYHVNDEDKIDQAWKYSENFEFFVLPNCRSTIHVHKENCVPEV